MKTPKPPYRLLIPVIALVLLTGAVRWIKIGVPDISHDEPFTIFHAQTSVPDIVERLKPYNNPPLYEILLHGWMKLTGGTGAVQTRSLSWLFAVLGIIPLFMLVNRFRGVVPAAAICLVYCFSSYHISFAHEARTYTCWLFFALWSMYAFGVLMTSGVKTFVLALYIVAGACMLYAHFFGIWVLFAQFVFALAHYRSLANTKRLWAGWMLIVLLFTPYLLIFIQRFSQSAQNGTWVTPPGPEALYDNIRKFCNEPLVAVIFLGLFVLSFFQRNKDLFGRYMVWAFALPYLLLFVLSFKVPMYVDRYLLFTAVPFYVVCTDSLWRLLQRSKKWKYALFALPALMLATVKLNPRLPYQNKAAAQAVMQHKTPGTAVVIVPEWFDISLYYYADRELFASPYDYREKAEKKLFFATHDVSGIRKFGKLIFVEGADNYMDPQRNNYRLLEQRYAKKQELLNQGNTPFKGLIITVFSD